MSISSLRADNMITYVFEKLRMRRATSNPSIPGRLTSSVVRIGWCSRTALIPSIPVAAGMQANPASLRMADSRFRTSASSSITTAVRS